MSARSRKIRVEALARVEGEGGLYVHLRGDEVAEIRLEIYEPPRLFEALLRGRPLEEVPDIVARICGICPIAYQMSSVHALEAALGCRPGEDIRRLRRLLYCGEWIESHTLHVHLLHAPDFLGYASGLDMAKAYRAEFERGLRLKKHGNRLLELFGGRAIHPINVAVGGFYRLPDRADVERLVPDFEWGLEAAVEMVRWIATFDFPDFEQEYAFVALSHTEEYAMNEGQIVSSDGLSISQADFPAHFAEQQVPHSTALHCRRVSTGASYLVGPLARVNLNLDQLAEPARRLAGELGVAWPCRNPHRAIVARGLEIVHAYAEALSILRDYRSFRPPRVAVDHRNAAGAAATEAPRGLLYHRYEVGDDGFVRSATIVPPTSQNQAQIEADLRQLVQALTAKGAAEIAQGCERLVRSYDPCISCSTHFLKLDLKRS